MSMRLPKIIENFLRKRKIRKTINRCNRFCDLEKGSVFYGLCEIIRRSDCTEYMPVALRLYEESLVSDNIIKFKADVSVDQNFERIRGLSRREWLYILFNDRYKRVARASTVCSNISIRRGSWLLFTSYDEMVKEAISMTDELCKNFRIDYKFNNDLYIFDSKIEFNVSNKKRLIKRLKLVREDFV